MLLQAANKFTGWQRNNFESPALARQMRSVFSSFDHFMVMFVATLGVVWSTVFMGLLGGPLHTYEARAIDAGWQSIRSGEAVTINEAFEIAASLPVEVVFPSAHATEPNWQRIALEREPARLELLGGPDPTVMAKPQRLPDKEPAIRITPLPDLASEQVAPVAELTCGVAAEACAALTVRAQSTTTA